MSSTFADQLVELLRPLRGCVVAYSGGVDSAVVAKAAALALGDRAVAVTGVSASLADGELNAARLVAREIGVRHVVIETAELDDENYRRNAPDRCFHCKTELYGRLRAEADRRGWSDYALANGANADDLRDFRPGLTAAAEHEVRSPLAECGLTKSDVRSLAKQWNLQAWDKPASPCLSSRVAYGVEVTPERLARIDAAEQALRRLGLGVVRVRLHADDLARIEAPPAELARLIQDSVREEAVATLRSLGFRFVSLDLEGFRSGSFLPLVPSEELARFAAR
jgi:uncharacterized protein